ncbi:TPA: LPXTG cell wall anchor domain-containing protein, partial [Streptococcus agalactiae]|nr:LPXTG cell wall anchor domain-containing protein [Streptococcus agalactiae]HEM9730420.1 LPXTG cell wall anchor domain-containing protein [Streptococcus agalactiae]HEN0006757.1 LPXTG cell wall anchor domain-containing protein [Streptococcus agalactiae]HEN0026852.1 LPXTG cell wall anchor domain-containing protein [Streptococcus agalactiae]
TSASMSASTSASMSASTSASTSASMSASMSASTSASTSSSSSVTSNSSKEKVYSALPSTGDQDYSVTATALGLGLMTGATLLGRKKSKKDKN